MPAFSYVARDDSGAEVEGQVTAASQAEATKMIRSEGKFVVRVAPSNGRHASRDKKTDAGAEKKGKNLFGEKFNPEDVIFFTNQLAVMVETGVSLAEALEGCTSDGNSPRFAKALEGVKELVNGGSEFSAALEEYPKVFPPIYISLVKASEASGLLGPMLERLAAHLQSQRDTMKKLKGAITYPIVMIVFAIGTTIFLMTFVLPKFSAIYAGREDSLPVITRALMSFSHGLASYGLYVLGVLIAASVGAFFYLRKPEGREFSERMRLRMPLIGPLMHRTYLARSLRTLGTMIQSGVSMLDSVRLTARACGSLQYEKKWDLVNQRLESGQQVSEALADDENIPKAVKKMLSAGERSGKLGVVMERVADYCEADLNVSIKTLTSLVEPAIVTFLGIVVGGLVLALLLPIFTISKAMH